MGHVLRLLKQGIELLKTGYLQVDRTGIDAKHLLNVRLGNVSYEDLMAEVDALMLEIDDAYQNSKLPKEPNYEKINNLTIELIQEGIKV